MSEQTCDYPGCADPRGFKTGRYCPYHQRKRSDFGLTRRHPAGPVNDHLEKLRELGWSYRQIEEYIGLYPHYVEHVKYRQKISHEKAHAILSVPLVPRSSLRATDSRVTLRQVQALCYMGWSRVRQAQMAGIHPGVMRSIKAGSASHKTVAAIDELYRKLCDKEGPDHKTATAARTAKYASPLMWEDIYDLDEPYPTYEYVKPKRAPRRKSASKAGWKKGVAWDEVPFLRSFGYSDEDIAQRIGVKVQTLRGRFPRKCVKRGCTNNQSTKSNVCRDHLL